MSLLLDALRRAEQERREQQGQVARNETASYVPERVDPPIAAMPEMATNEPSLPTHAAVRVRAPLELAAAESLAPTLAAPLAQLSPLASALPPAPSAPAAAPGRARAETLFAASSAPPIYRESTLPAWLLPLGLALVALPLIGYFAYQVVTLNRSSAGLQPAARAVAPIPLPLAVDRAAAEVINANKANSLPKAGQSGGAALDSLSAQALSEALTRGLFRDAIPVRSTRDQPARAPGGALAVALAEVKQPQFAELPQIDIRPTEAKPRPPRQVAPKNEPIITSQSSAPAVDTDLALARRALASRRWGDAEALYRRARASNPSDINIYLGLGYLAGQQGDLVLAQAHYAQALALDGQNPTALQAQALLQQASRPGDAESASTLSQQQQTYFEALRRDPRSPNALYNLAASLDQLNQRQAALTYYEQALARLCREGQRADCAPLGGVRFDVLAVEQRVTTLQAEALERAP